MRRLCALLIALSLPNAVAAFVFDGIDGRPIDLSAFHGQPVLVVNTASQCGFTHQYDGLQALYDTYRGQGLVVLAVPSNDFAQELATDAAVKEFCEVNFNLDIPMTTMSHVKGRMAHPFYSWAKETAGFTPKWNFNKVLLGPDGEIVATYPSGTAPMSKKVTMAVEALLD